MRPSADRVPAFRALGVVAMLVLALVQTRCASSGPAVDGPAESGGETVNMGFDAEERDGMVSSVSTVDETDTGLIQPRTIADLLRGRVPGVQIIDGPGGTVQVRIRGSRSLLGSNEPLLVVDGLTMAASEGLMQAINPNDVESISVLKDASATAAYGSRGANGVIVIRTRRGTPPG